MTAPVTLEGVTRRYGDTAALDGVDLALEPGSLTGLLGPNGAGKSTLVNLVSGLRRADSGTVRLFGGDPHDAVNRIGLGTTLQQTGVAFAGWTVETAVVMAGWAYRRDEGRRFR